MSRAAHGHYAELLDSGVRIFEYEANVLHAKSMVVDDYVSVVGSTNLDVRSFLFNSEQPGDHGPRHGVDHGGRLPQRPGRLLEIKQISWQDR